MFASAFWIARVADEFWEANSAGLANRGVSKNAEFRSIDHGQCAAPARASGGALTPHPVAEAPQDSVGNICTFLTRALIGMEASMRNATRFMEAPGPLQRCPEGLIKTQAPCASPDE